MTHLIRAVVLVSPLLAGAAAVTASAAAPAPEAQLARVLVPVTAHARPTERSRVLMRVSPYTDFTRDAHVLLVTGRRVERPGRRWVRVRLPRRPNGSQGWIREEFVVLARTKTRIVVRVHSRRVEVWRGARRVMSVRADVGTSATPTPLGRFAVHDPVPTTPAARPTYGRYIITLTAYSTVLRTFNGGNGLVAIHGYAGVGGNAVSHGCVRVTDGAVVRLRRYASPGVPVDIVAR